MMSHATLYHKVKRIDNDRLTKEFINFTFLKLCILCYNLDLFDKIFIFVYDMIVVEMP